MTNPYRFLARLTHLDPGQVVLVDLRGHTIPATVAGPTPPGLAVGDSVVIHVGHDGRCSWPVESMAERT